MQVFDTGVEMLPAGVLDGDPSPGNGLDDRALLRLFDAGYTDRRDANARLVSSIP